MESYRSKLARSNEVAYLERIESGQGLANAVIREQIQRDLSTGKTDDETRFHARRIRDRFLLPVPDMQLEHILWREVAIFRGGLV